MAEKIEVARQALSELAEYREVFVGRAQWAEFDATIGKLADAMQALVEEVDWLGGELERLTERQQ